MLVKEEKKNHTQVIKEIKKYLDAINSDANILDKLIADTTLIFLNKIITQQNNYPSEFMSVDQLIPIVESALHRVQDFLNHLKDISNSIN